MKYIDLGGGYKTLNKGVARRRDNGRYRAYIRVNKKLIHLGHFHTALEAAKCYNKAAEKYFGEFASPNTI